MLDLAKVIYENLSQVTSEAHHVWNYSKQVVYPYATYSLNSQKYDENVEEFYLDIQLFDNSHSYNDLFKLENDLRSHFKDLKIMTNELFVRCRYIRSDDVPTTTETIKRRDLQFICRVDWRNK